MPKVQNPRAVPVEHPTISARPEHNKLPIQICIRCGRQYPYNGSDVCDECKATFKGGPLAGLTNSCGEDGCDVSY